MSRPKVDGHHRERGELVRDVEDLDQLVLDVIAAGPSVLPGLLGTMSAPALRRLVLDEVVNRARVLLLESRGDRVRARDLLVRERRRWTDAG